MSISDNIKAIRTQKGIAQAEIARRLEIEPSSYHRLENRGDKLTLEQAENIAKALGVTRLELLTWGDPKDARVDSADNSQFQKRIAELEDRLKDKDKLIQYTELEFDNLKHSLMMYIWDNIDRDAMAKSIGKVSLYYTDPERIVQMEMADYLNVINGNEKIIEEGYYKERIELTDEQIKDIFYHHLRDNPYRELISNSYLMGFLTSEKLRNMYMEYEKTSYNHKFRLWKD